MVSNNLARAAEGADTKEIEGIRALQYADDALFECLDILMDLDAGGRQHSDICDCEDCGLYERISKVTKKHEGAFHRLSLIDALQRSIARQIEIKAAR